MNTEISASDEKFRVAITSVVAAIGLTAMKFVVGLMTGSLGILSEAAHSGLDLVAALVTVFAVRASAWPPDADHPYGHGKVENLSALFETLLLLLTCLWIIREAVERLFFHPVPVKANLWGFLVIATSIIVDIGLPDMSGKKVIAAAVQHRPGTPVIRCSGASGTSPDVGQKIHVFPKPYSATELSKFVASLISQTSP